MPGTAEENIMVLGLLEKRLLGAISYEVRIRSLQPESQSQDMLPKAAASPRTSLRIPKSWRARKPRHW